MDRPFLERGTSHCDVAGRMEGAGESDMLLCATGETPVVPVQRTRCPLSQCGSCGRSSRNGRAAS